MTFGELEVNDCFTLVGGKVVHQKVNSEEAICLTDSGEKHTSHSSRWKPRKAEKVIRN